MKTQRHKDTETQRKRRGQKVSLRRFLCVSVSLCLCVFISVSVFDSQLKLEYARQIRLSRGIAEVCIGNVRINAPEANIIEEVERINPEHKPYVFPDLKIPSEAQILIKE